MRYLPRLSCLVIFSIGLLTLQTGMAHAEAFPQSYGSSVTQNKTTTAGTHSFSVEGIAQYKYTEWYVGGTYKETDDSGFLAIDPGYSYSFSGGTTVIKAIVYNSNWTVKETHIWNITVAYILTVNSNVNGASVYLDNIYKGTTSGLWAPYGLAISGVASGSHQVKVSKSGWETNTVTVNVSSNTTTAVNLRKNTSVAVTSVTGVVGTNVTLEARLTDSDGGGVGGKTLTFYVDGVNKGTGVTNNPILGIGGGYATRTISTSGMTVGNHSVRVTFAGDTDYTGSEATRSDGLILTGYKLIVQSNVNGATVYLDGVSKGTTSGLWAPYGLDIASVTPGNHEVKVSKSGWESKTVTMNVSTDPTTATVNLRQNTSVTISSVVAVVNSNATLEARLTDSDGGGLGGKTLTFYVDGVNKGSGVTNNPILGIGGGYATRTISTSGMTVGNHSVRVTFAGDTDYTGSEATRSDGLILTGYKLIVQSNVNGATVYLDGVSKGTTSGLWAPYGLDIASVTPGNHEVKVSKSGWETNTVTVNVSSNTTTAVNLRKNTSVAVTSVTGVVGTNVTLEARLTDSDGGGVGGKTLTFYVDGVNKGTGVTNNPILGIGGGYATRTISTSGMTVGNHSVRVTFAGDTDYTGSEATRSDGLILTGYKLIVQSNVNGATVYLDGVSKGTTSGLWAPYGLDIASVTPGNHEVKVSKSGWESKTVTMNVSTDPTTATVNLRQNTSVTISSVVAVVNSNATLEARLTDSDGGGLGGKTLTFYVDGVNKGSGVTNNPILGIGGGYATRTISTSGMTVGNHSVRVTFAGDTDYTGSEATRSDGLVLTGYTLNIQSNVDGASIFLDGVSKGKTSKAWPWSTPSLDIPNVTPSPASHQVVVSQSGYESKTVTVVLTTNPYPVTVNLRQNTSIAVTSVVAVVNSNGTLEARLTDSGGGGVGGKTLTFYVDGVNKGTGVTNNPILGIGGGYATRTISTSGMTVGNHSVRVTFAGDADYTSSEATNPLGLTLQASISVTLKNWDGVNAAPSLTRFVLHTTPVQSKSGSNPAAYTEINPGTYKLQGCQTGTFFGEEIWASQQVKVDGNKMAVVTLTRDYPYAFQTTFYNDFSGIEIMPGQEIKPGTTVRAEVKVINRASSPLSSKIHLVMDRDKSVGYDFDQTSATQIVLGNSSSPSIFVFRWKPEAWRTGQFYYAIEVLTALDGGDVRTDSWTWGNTFKFVAIKPIIVSFSIDKGVLTTKSRTVTLYYECSNYPTHYMASESSIFAGAAWQPYAGTSTTFTLSPTLGAKTVYFKVKNDSGECLTIAIASIQYGDSIPAIVGFVSPYCSQSKKAYFISGVPLNQTFTATINWNSFTPSQVKWYRNAALLATDTVAGTSVSRTFDVGKGLNVGDRLYVQAIASDGTMSPQVAANCEIIPAPPGLGSILFFQDSGVLGTSDPKYKSFPFNIGFPEIKKDAPPTTDKNKIAEIAQVDWNSIVEVTAEVDLSGHAEINAGSDLLELPKDDFKLSVLEVGGTLELVLTFDYVNNQWKPGGGFDLTVSGEYTAPPTYVVFLVGPVPVPTYYRFAIDASVSANCRFSDGSADKPVFSGDIPVTAGIEGMAGVGVADCLAVEGYLRGGLNFDFQIPQEPFLKDWYLSLDGGIRIVLIFYTFEDNLLSYRWPSDQDGTSFGARAVAGTDLKPMGRDYLVKDYAQWHDGGNTMKSMGTQSLNTGGLETTLQTNVFGQSNAILAVSGNTRCLIWLYDKPSRNSLDRTMLVYSMNNGSGWSSPAVIDDDGTADAMPAMVVDTSGRFTCVWANASQLIPDGTNLAGFADKLDIKMATYDTVSGLWTPETVTNAGALDYNPKVSCDASGNLTVLWTHDDNNDMLAEHQPVRNALLARTKSDTGWLSLQSLTIANGLVKYSDIESDAVGSHIVYCLDGDSNLQTDTDNELYYISNTGGTWSIPIRLTNDTVADVNPQLVKTSTGLMLLWARDGKIVSTSDIPGMTGITEVVAQQGSSGQRSFIAAVSPTDNISVIWNDPSKMGSDIYTATYDPTMSAWSDVVQITDNRDMERSICAAYASADRLELAYNKVHVADGNGLGVFGQVDMCVYEYLIGPDLVVSADNIILTDPNSVPGEIATLRATVRNIGDTTIDKVPVAFYCGYTASPANQIGLTQIVSGSLAAGEQRAVSVSWNIPESNEPLNVIVVADPDLQIEDKNRQNNSAAVEMFGADLAIVNVVVDSGVDENCYVTADITNKGFATAFSGAEFILSTTDNSIIFDSQQVITLERGQSHRITLAVPAKRLKSGSNELKLVIDPNNMIVELSKANNTRVVWIQLTDPGTIAINKWETAVVHGNSELLNAINDGYVEARTKGITKLRVYFNKAMDTSLTSPSLVTLASTGGTINPTSLSWESSTCLVVNLASPLPDKNKYTVEVSSSVKSADGASLGGDRDICLTALKGDANGSLAVNADDLSAIRAHVAESVSSTNARYDVNCNGVINAQDLLAVQACLGNTAAGCQ